MHDMDYDYQHHYANATSNDLATAFKDCERRWRSDQRITYDPETFTVKANLPGDIQVPIPPEQWQHLSAFKPSEKQPVALKKSRPYPTVLRNC